MNAFDNINLTLTNESIDSYCRDLVRRIATVEKRIAALDALNTFISATADPGEKSKPAFTAILSTLNRHFEQARTDLLNEYMHRLSGALQQHELPRITPIYSALSRDSFWQLLIRINATHKAGTTQEIAAWCKEWMEGAKRRAKANSPYPDAIDFKAAGIDVTEYITMSDLYKFFVERR